MAKVTEGMGDVPEGGSGIISTENDDPAVSNSPSDKENAAENEDDILDIFDSDPDSDNYTESEQLIISNPPVNITGGIFLTHVFAK